MPIYRDSLGQPNSKAIISEFGAKYGQPGTGRLVFKTISNAPDRQWPYVSRDVSGIVAEMEADGWQCSVEQDGYGAPRIICTHIETQALIDHAQSLSNAKFANAERGFIRFGDLPESGYSLNYRDNTQEAGVSVFEAEFSGSEYRILLSTQYEQASLLHFTDRPVYRVWGEVVGTGADGEPLLRVDRAVRLPQ